MFGEDDEGEDHLLPRPDSSPGGDEGEALSVVVPALALVASEALKDEEVFLNYRLSTHVERPEWYHPVDAEEDKRRWASD
jgi:hypothetical protein